MEQKNDFKFGDPIFVQLGQTNIKEAIYIASALGCAVVALDAPADNYVLHVNFDLIWDRNENWIPFPFQEPKYETPYIVTVRDDSGDSVRYYTTTGWRSNSFIQENAWIVDDEVNFNVVAWMPFPEPYE